MNRQFQWLRRIAVVMVLGGLLTLSATAESGFFTPYSGYEYDTNGNSVPAPISYVLENEVSANNLGLQQNLSSAADLYVDGNYLYVLDSGNSRILQLDSGLKLVRVLSGFTFPGTLNGSGEDTQLDFTGAQGLVVKGNAIYIADTKNQRIVKIVDNRVAMVIRKPNTSMVPGNTPFYVTKLAVNDKGNIYAIAESINIGAFMFSADGQFLKFFGSNPVTKTSDVIMKYMERKFMTRQQIAAMPQYTPVNISNFDLENNGFMVTVTRASSSDDIADTVKELNYNGEDILNSAVSHNFGDLEWDRIIKKGNGTRLTDVEVDKDGFYYLLDSMRGRVFIYLDGRFVTEFSCLGDQRGSVRNPTALESMGERVFVLDAEKNCIDVFHPTPYGEACRQAMLSLKGAQPVQSISAWKKLLAMNTNNENAYWGLGEALESKGDFQQAMVYFKKAYDNQSYSEAFGEYRTAYIKKNYLWLMLAVIGIALALIVAVRILKKQLALKRDGTYSAMESRYAFPFYTAMHPADGFEQFRSRKMQSKLVILVIAVIWALIAVAKYFLTGFAFNTSHAVDFNLFVTLAQTLGIGCLFVISNWAVCTLLNGKGRLIEIAAAFAYSLIPYLISQAVYVLLSNAFTIEEGTFLQFVTFVGITWSGIVLFVALFTIHEYTAGQTLGSVCLTVIGMAIIVFLMILLYTLITQTVAFGQSIMQEISLRS